MPVATHKHKHSIKRPLNHLPLSLSLLWLKTSSSSKTDELNFIKRDLWQVSEDLCNILSCTKKRSSHSSSMVDQKCCFNNISDDEWVYPSFILKQILKKPSSWIMKEIFQCSLIMKGRSEISRGSLCMEGGGPLCYLNFAILWLAEERLNPNSVVD